MSHERSFNEIMWLNYRQFLIKKSIVIISNRLLCTSWMSHDRSFSEIMWLNYRQFLIKTIYQLSLVNKITSEYL